MKNSGVFSILIITSILLILILCAPLISSDGYGIILTYSLRILAFLATVGEIIVISLVRAAIFIGLPISLYWAFFKKGRHSKALTIVSLISIIIVIIFLVVIGIILTHIR